MNLTKRCYFPINNAKVVPIIKINKINYLEYFVKELWGVLGLYYPLS